MRRHPFPAVPGEMGSRCGDEVRDMRNRVLPRPGRRPDHLQVRVGFLPLRRRCRHEGPQEEGGGCGQVLQQGRETQSGYADQRLRLSVLDHRQRQAGGHRERLQGQRDNPRPVLRRRDLRGKGHPVLQRRLQRRQGPGRFRVRSDRGCQGCPHRERIPHHIR